MQTILGANGQIAEELARDLHRNYTTDIRLVSRNPRTINKTDTLFPANLLDAQATADAVKGSSVAYLTVGLPMNSQLWEDQFPAMMRNTIDACKLHRCKLAFFDNTYMYPKTSVPQTEETPFEPEGRKSFVRAEMATMLLDEMAKGDIEAVICRAPEFYGPGKTQSITNSLIFDNIVHDKKLKVPLTDNTLRTLIWTPDASRAIALLGNTHDAYGQTWHLPCDDNRLTYEGLIEMASEVYGKRLEYKTLKMWMFKIGALFKEQIRELQELLPRYECDNIFVSQKFTDRFSDFNVTTYRDGVTQLMRQPKTR